MSGFVVCFLYTIHQLLFNNIYLGTCRVRWIMGRVVYQRQHIFPPARDHLPSHATDSPIPCDLYLHPHSHLHSDIPGKGYTRRRIPQRGSAIGSPRRSREYRRSGKVCAGERLLLRDDDCACHWLMGEIVVVYRDCWKGLFRRSCFGDDGGVGGDGPF